MSKVTYDTGEYRLTINDDQVSSALGELRSKTNAVLKVAINRTARQARKDVIAESLERYDLTAKGKEKAKQLRMRRLATNAVLMAELRQSDKGLPLDFAYFRHVPTTVFKGGAVKHAPQYVQGRVLKSQAMHDLTEEAGRSKGFLVEFMNKRSDGTENNHIGMVQRVIGSRAEHDETRRGYRRWKPNEALVTMARPGGSGMGRAVWELGVEDWAAENLMNQTARRLQEVIEKSRSRSRK